MSSEIFYRDIRALPGEDRVMTTSALFRALHGCQKTQGIPLVLVPFSLDGRDPQVIREGRVPDGIRVFSNREDILATLVLNPMVDDTVQMKRVIAVDGSETRQHIRVRRLRVPCHAEISRYEERKSRHDRHDIEGFAAANLSRRMERSRPGVHFWMQKDGTKYPFFLSVQIMDGQAGFSSSNTYGCGTVPLVDF